MNWTHTVFEPGERDPEAVEADLRSEIRTTDEAVLREEDRDDPDTWIDDDGRVVWSRYGAPDAETFAALDVPCDRALVIQVSDTDAAGFGFLYERVDGAFLRTDAHADRNAGRACLDYFLLEHGLRGDRRA